MHWPLAAVLLVLSAGALGQYAPESEPAPPSETLATVPPDESAEHERVTPVVEVPKNTHDAPTAAAVPEPPVAAAPPPVVELPPAVATADANASSAGVIGNPDVLDMTRAQFSESTILAAIAANETRFDVSTRALVALKGAGVSEKVIEAMLSAETANRKAATAAKSKPAVVEAPVAEVAPPPAAPTPPAPSAEYVRLSAMIERLAAQQDAATAARRAPEPPPTADPAPRAWILSEGDRMAVSPTIAQVALTDDKTGNRMKTLQGLAGKALVFVNPAVGGIATTLGGLFKSDNEKRTAIWALVGTTSARELRSQPVFEIEFGHIPGVDPDEYQPALVRLVPTKDNYRLVAAAKTEGSKAAQMPDGPIIEEPVLTLLTQLGRGRYRAAVNGTLPTGEYALVLRPIDKDDRGRRKRRKAEASLGDLLGGGVGQILYFTWDFAVAG